jgi:hypothetical protein
MNREQVTLRRPSPEERRQQVHDDLRRTIGFLTAVVAEAEHLGLPVPANAPELLANLDAWQAQLSRASGSRSARDRSACPDQPD